MAITKVEHLLNGVLIDKKITPPFSPYTTQVGSLDAGTHTITVNAYKDGVLHSSDSKEIFVSDVFISTWDTRNVTGGVGSVNDITLPFVSSNSQLNMNVDWGDGTSSHITDIYQPEMTHTYATPGVYTIKISGILKGFMNFGPLNRLKILEIKRWGCFKPLGLRQSFNDCTNLNCSAVEDVLDLSFIEDNKSLYKTFYNCLSLTGINRINEWDISGITSLAYCFAYTKFNSDISQWNTSDVTTMEGMFQRNIFFNQPIDSWDVSKVTDMSYMFEGTILEEGTSQFNQNLNSWDVSMVTNMSYMFNWAVSFNGDVSSWQINSLQNAKGLFRNARVFNKPIGNWDVSGVTDMSFMFNQALAFNQDLSLWDVSGITDMTSVFSFATSFDQDITTWNTENVTDMKFMFSNAHVFNQPIGNWDVSGVTDMSYMFNSALAFNQPLNNWNTIMVGNFENMFSRAVLFNQPLNNWNTLSAGNMASMFRGAESFDSDISTWNTSSVTNMEFMFSASDVLNYKPTTFNQPIGNWDTGYVTNMQYMFNRNFVFNQPIGNWDVGNVTDMSFMFERTTFNQPLNSWNTSNVTKMRGMFLINNVINQNFGNWNISKVTDLTYFNQLSNGSTNITFSTNNLDAIYNGWSSLPSLKPNLTLNMGNSKYSATGKVGRDILINTYGWTILDGGMI